jgi:hypothetical protein
VLLVAEEADHKKAKKLLGDVADHARLVGPGELYEAVLETIA